jgi:GDP-L-fucose synthase|tara:strand:+ start:13033 stop:13956 length:924 start_codon:yes stop_codon:yes gene_type:complete
MSILVTGGTGMIGHAIKEIMPQAKFIGSSMYDLRNQNDVEFLFYKEKPDYVLHLAAKVGGVEANYKNPGKFYYDNIMINTNVLECSRKHKVKKVLSVLSTCIYPDSTTYPLVEEKIHNGEPHYTNYAYAYAKRMLDIQSRSYRDQYGCNFTTLVPNNLFGECDNFDLSGSHVIPAIIRKVYEAKLNNTNLSLWGDGKSLREFTYSKDLAKIMLLLLEKYDGREPINVGNPKEYSIKDVTSMITKIMDYDGEVVWDTNRESGQYRKPSDNSKLLDLGWGNKDYTSLEDSLKNTCNWFSQNYPNVRGIK